MAVPSGKHTDITAERRRQWWNWHYRGSAAASEQGFGSSGLRLVSGLSATRGWLGEVENREVSKRFKVFLYEGFFVFWHSVNKYIHIYIRLITEKSTHTHTQNFDNSSDQYTSLAIVTGLLLRSLVTPLTCINWSLFDSVCSLSTNEMYHSYQWCVRVCVTIYSWNIFFFIVVRPNRCFEQL